MPRKGYIAKREVLPDPIYKDRVVTKLINNIMLDGKKGIAQRICYKAFDIIKDKTAFLTYIAFLLSDDYLSAFLESIKNGKGDYRFLNMNYETPILYERMLKAAANSPDSLREVNEIISLTGNDIVPKDFARLYAQFEKAVKL